MASCQAAPPAVEAPVSPNDGSSIEREQDMLVQVNRVRAVNDLRPLVFQDRLWKAAKDHSWEQARYGYMGHGSPDPERNTLSQRIRQAGFDGSAFGEVVAWGYPTNAAVVEGWMNSPGHRRILLDPELTEAGFGHVGGYWTGNLGAPRRGTTLAAAPDYARSMQGAAPAPAPAPLRVPTARPAPSSPAPAVVPAPVRAAPAPARVAAPAPVSPPPPTVSSPARAVPADPAPRPLAPAPPLPYAAPG